ncbi:acyltransferase [Pseudoalteromonas sp. NSLLW24]|uniref:acyltransferase family protein n=1 Tax=Pseudoalteromonas sp. NSLLW24 TaxID=2792050 RepID=UPI0018CF281F|nr:acyltransferase family protein [Pseudoalteromonas sp. NSLLW24]MBG9997473.1 acyltransferase [Pseudoalteromonas sp. NSLLW24]
MQFREDINGLRAIAVIAVVLFHFNSSWMPGGFAGVDVFFVISGFLMTGIIFKGLEQEKFSILRFYVARANRIIPALSLLCFILLIFGWFYISPIDYEALGIHAASSMSFLSNIVYWRESGYFDVSSHEKWLLHTWSLSVEWQFYIIYPLVLVMLHKLISLRAIKLTILIGTILGFLFCVLATYKWSEAAYYLLPTRAWEMMIGGVAYLYPFNIKEKQKIPIEWTGITLIFGSYFLITKDTPWPGYLAILPVFGSFLVIQAQRNNSLITSNIIFNKLGSWSYSIYLWHWLIVVAISYFSLSRVYIYPGILISVLLGFLSYKYVEKINFRNDYNSLFSYLKCKPLYMGLFIVTLGSVTFIKDGFIYLSSPEYQSLIYNAQSSPFRNKCNIKEYRAPAESCEYFGRNISWATLGDSHSIEIAYALAEKLKLDNIGLKQFSFSGCRISYKEAENFGKCAKWYNETVDYILNKDKIKNVVFNHRFTGSFFWGEPINYPEHSDSKITDEIVRMTKHMDELIFKLALKKDNVYIFYPIPELQRNINQLIGVASRTESSLVNILGTDLDWYKERNKYIISHFDNSNYPSNVHFIKPQDAFCDEKYCYAVRDSIPLYFDDDHPSILGAAKLVGLIKEE